MSSLAQAPAVHARADTLERNLRALAKNCPALVQLLRSVEPARDVEFVDTPQGPSAVHRGRALASRRRPLDEAARFAEQLDPRRAGCAVVLGFGLGRHVQQLVKRMDQEGLVFVFEPDLPLLRAVLERVDHSAWLGSFGLRIFHDADDAAAISQAAQGAEGLMAIGVKILEHPPSAQRLGPQAKRFAEAFTRVFAAVRTVVVTTMVQMEATFRNGLMNLDHYVQDPGVADLQGRCAQRPAIVIAAGPSLARNIEELRKPLVRERFVLIAVQTALKPLLQAGIKPHFVVSLDYHEISRRFFEGLSPADVEGVQLIVEPKANAVVADAFPGQVRCPADPNLDTLLGPELAGEHGSIPAGSTVAHLAHYVARHLGCDPVVLVGQDLAFTDGLYYGPGAAIHQVWAGELNPFNTLEMLEWERIVRSRRTLRRLEDQRGRPVYADEQMATYLAQFERDFLSDEERGLRVIDATEGGARKAHTTAMPLAQAIETLMPDEPLPDLAPPLRSDGAEALRRAVERVRSVRRDAGALVERCVEARGLLEKAVACAGDARRVNALIEKVHKVRDRATALRPAYDLAQRLNQTGGFNRARADRELRLEKGLTGAALQKRQLERDVRNLRWLEDSARRLVDLLDASLAALEGRAPKRTRDPMPADEEAPAAVTARSARLVGVVSLLGTAAQAQRDLAGRPVLDTVLRRLSRCGSLTKLALLTDQPQLAHELLQGAAVRGAVEIVPVEEEDRAAAAQRLAAVARARALAQHCWRGGVANLTCFDALFEPCALARAMQRLEADAALLVGATWAGIDPRLCDAVVERHLESPGKHRFVFTQAAPGFAPALLSRSLAEELAEGRDRAGVFASLGGAVGYLPIRPCADPVASSVCVAVEQPLRDALWAATADSRAQRRRLEAALAALGEDPATVEARALAAALGRVPAPTAPGHLLLEVTTRRIARGLRLAWAMGAGEALAPPEPQDMPVEQAARLVEQLARERDDLVVSLDGRGDPLLHPQIAELVAAVRDAGAFAVLLRTDLLDAREQAQAALEAGCDVLSVDLLAHSATTYTALTGLDRFDEVRSNLLALLESVERPAGLPQRWIVPRITRCDAALGEIEQFFDEWIMRAGWAVIDPAPRAQERAAPLPAPPLARRRLETETLAVRRDGALLAAPTFAADAVVLGSLDEAPALWKRILAQRGRDDTA